MTQDSLPPLPRMPDEGFMSDYELGRLQDFARAYGAECARAAALAEREAAIWAKQYDDGTWAACRRNEVITAPTFKTAEAAIAAAIREGK